MRHQWFTCVRLSNPYMTCLTTPFNRNVHDRTLSVSSRLRLFEASSCKPTSEGHPPSRIQHRGQTTTSEHVHGTTLRSPSITKGSTLLRDNPPPACASLLSPFVVRTYR